ncbi:hypothetical protein D1872_256300 [compost metagenome]
MILSKLTEVAEVLVRAITPFLMSSGGLREKRNMEFTAPSELTDKSGSSQNRSNPYPNANEDTGEISREPSIMRRFNKDGTSVTRLAFSDKADVLKS